MKVDLMVVACKDNEEIATVVMPKEIMEQISSSFPSLDTVKEFVNATVPVADCADELTFFIRYTNLNKEE